MKFQMKSAAAIGLMIAVCAASTAALAAPAMPSGAYAEFLGGGSLPGTITYFDRSTGVPNATDTFPAAFAGAAAVGVDFLPGLSGEVDLFYTSRDTLGSGKYPLTTASVMANLKYTVDLTDNIGLFGAVGIGGMYMRLSDTLLGIDYTNGWGAGYQLQIGASVKLADNISAVAEYRYENSFAPIAGLQKFDSEQAGQSALLAGIRVGF